jgi:hypothetical protein
MTLLLEKSLLIWKSSENENGTNESPETTVRYSRTGRQKKIVDTRRKFNVDSV